MDKDDWIMLVVLSLAVFAANIINLFQISDINALEKQNTVMSKRLTAVEAELTTIKVQQKIQEMQNDSQD